MRSYQHFAHVYDHFMADTPYRLWALYIDHVIKRGLNRDANSTIVLDMACGTGGLTLAMAALGYDMIGLDISADMLAEAREKTANKSKSILWLKQDMRALDLFGTVDAALCACDGLNYLLAEDELSAVFAGVRKFLNPGGMFIFDMNTEYKFREILSDNIFKESAGDVSYIWENHYNQCTGINEYDIQFSIRGRALRGKLGSRRQVFREAHLQRAYPREAVILLLEAAGFNNVRVNDAYTDERFTPDSERLTFIASVSRG